MSENQSAAVVNSTVSKTPEKKAQLAAYMREYRKRRKLATEAAKIVDRDMGTTTEESSLVGPSIEAGSA